MDKKQQRPAESREAARGQSGTVLSRRSMESLQQGTTELVQQSTALAVQTNADRLRAADLWDALRAFRKQAEAQKEDVTRPLKTAWEEAKRPYDTFIKECQVHEAALQAKMRDYDQAQMRLMLEAQAKLTAQIEAKNAQAVERAERKGSEPVLIPTPILPTVPKTLVTQAGTGQTKTTVKRWSIAGLSPEAAAELPASDARLAALPRTVLRIHAATITALVRAGLTPEGVEVYEDLIYRQTGKGA